MGKGKYNLKTLQVFNWYPFDSDHLNTTYYNLHPVLWNTVHMMAIEWKVIDD